MIGWRQRERGVPVLPGGLDITQLGRDAGELRHRGHELRVAAVNALQAASGQTEIATAYVA